MSYKDGISAKDPAEVQRLFVALRIPDEIVLEIVGLMDGIKKGLKFVNFPMSWTKPDSIHLTLKFLGDVSSHRIGEIVADVGRITMQYRALRLKVHEIGVFPGWKRPRVLWVGVGCSDQSLKLMQEQIWNVLDKYSRVAEKNQFHPHLTIARFKQGNCSDSAKNIILSHRRFKTGHFEGSEAALFRSVPSPSGVVHQCIKAFEISKGGPPEPVATN